MLGHPGPRLCYDPGVKNEFTAIIQRDGEWFVAFSPEVPGGNGQGRTRDEAIASLAASIDLIFDDLRDDALAEMPRDAELVTVTVG